MTANTHRAPKGLQNAGKRLWRSVVEDLELEEHELALLRAACRTADNLERLAEELETAPTTTQNARGDMVANPVYVEHRNQAQSLAKTLASLRLPTGLTDDGDLVRPQRRGAARGAYGLRSVQ